MSQRQSAELLGGESPTAAACKTRYFEELVHAKADDIVRKWIDFFVLHKRITSEVLTRRVRWRIP
jgi:hypothetical protein